VKNCMLDVNEVVFQENGATFVNVHLSTRTTVCRAKEVNNNLSTQLRETVQTLFLHSTG
jgi:hypothetical protein